MSTEPLERAYGAARSVLSNVSREQLTDRTPCTSWDVAALVNHVVGGAHWFASSMEGDVRTTGDAPDFAAGDYRAAFDQAAARAVAAFQAPGAMEKTVELPFGTFSGAAVVGIATTDVFTHTWDLARATGQDASGLDPELADQLLGQVRPFIVDAFRGADGQALFGPEQEAPEDASPADRLAAFLGRRV